MSSNIISLDGKRIPSVLRVTPAGMFHHIRALWVAGVIGQDAYFLGNLLLGSMQNMGGVTVAVMRPEVLKVYTAAPTGQVLTGMVGESRIAFITALQELHDKGGIHSAKSPDEFDETDMLRRHFTRSPVTARSHWDDETTIYFRLTTESGEVFGEKVADLFRERMTQARTAVTIKL